ncbi:TolC family protein [Snuella lapsa]|uniref:TolC family protein n=1 Tax=Snuella lapsa TaxID=870481 RepID=A0ABP6WW17_9FLAO
MVQLKKEILIVFCLISITVFSQERKWSLQDCVTHALNNNITVKRTENQLLIDEQDVVAAKGRFLPSLSASASHGISLGQTELFTGSFVNRTSHSTSFGVGSSATVFNGLRIKNSYELSKLNLETTNIELSKIKDDISLNVVDAYLRVLFNKENLEIAQVQYEFSLKQLDQVKGLVDAGVQPRANIYDAEATLSRDSQNVTVAENNYNLALLSLSQLLQVPFEGFNVETIAVDTPSEALLYKTVTPVLNHALGNRQEITLAERNIEKASLNTEISKSGYYPSVSLSYGFGTSAFYSNLTDNEPEFLSQLNDNKGHRFSLSLNIPVFSKFQNKTAVAKAKIQEKNRQLDLEQAKLTVESNIQRAFTDAQAAFKTFEAAKKSLVSQELAFNNSKERYNIGSMTAYELEQARVALINAQSSLINAKYDFVFKTKVLDFYMGKTLTPR